MTLPPRPPPPNADDGDQGFTDSDRVWLERLAGRDSGPALTPAQREADLLREVLPVEAEEAWARRMSDEEAERQWKRVEDGLAAAAAGGAGAAGPASAPAGSAARAPARVGAWARLRDALFGVTASPGRRWTLGGAVAGLALLAVVLLPVLQDERDVEGPPLPPGMKLYGEGDARIQRIVTKTPRRDAEAFAVALRGAALKPGLYRDPDASDGRVVFVDLDLEAEQLEAAAVIFAARKLQKPGVGFARVVFRKPQE